MILLENTVTASPEQWRAAIMGARNPMNSWDKSDSGTCLVSLPCHSCHENRNNCKKNIDSGFVLGENDFGLMQRLSNAGTDHRKFMRMLPVYVRIVAPLYWWKEFDTYKVGTVANSCSTMHKIHNIPITEESFSFDHVKLCDIGKEFLNELEKLRCKFNETNDKKYWYALIQLLPESYNQTRNVMMNYEVLANIYKSRKDHKLDEWREFCKWIEKLPYSELITGESNENTDHQTRTGVETMGDNSSIPKIHVFNVTSSKNN